MRTLLGLCVVSACATQPPAAGEAVTAPTIWLEPSASIDPSALPLRDQHYVTAGAQAGYVYVCDPLMYRQSGAPGSQRDGDWIDASAATFDMTAKLYFGGNVFYPDAQLSITTGDGVREIAGNGRPGGAPTGTFPVPSSDPAYVYDGNPNQVTTQAIAFSIPLAPVAAAAPSCVYKEVGITLDGIQIHNPLDSTGRDELAHEVQDVCTGAPQPGGGYHRHALSECTPHIHEPAALVGYALDGFGIYSPYDETGRELTTADLDECHGITSTVEWEGQQVSIYHYVMTRDFPYTVSCFRGTPTRNAFPPLPGAPPQT